MRVVMKFGGTSVADGPAIRRVASIVARDRRPRLVVVSALAGVTDALLALAESAGHGRRAAAIDALDGLRARHHAVAANLTEGEIRTELIRRIDGAIAELTGLVEAIARSGAASPAARDAVAAAGEHLSSQLVAAGLFSAGLRCAWVDARQVVVTDDRFTRAAPVRDRTASRATARIGPLLDEGVIAVLGGFIGSTADGRTTTLGRGGSDWSASLLGACLGAGEIQIWTDVDGILTADPDLVPEARLVPRLSYADAYDLARLGAKVVHPATIAPAAAAGIPIRIRNSHRSAADGTLINGRAASPASVAALACRRRIAVLTVRRRRRDDRADRLAAVLNRVRDEGLAVLSETRSGSVVTLAVEPGPWLGAIIDELREIAEASCRDELGLVSVIGGGLERNTRARRHVLAALGDQQPVYPARASGRAISVVLPASRVGEAAARVHRTVFGPARASRVESAGAHGAARRTPRERNASLIAPVRLAPPVAARTAAERP
jgi:aspartate kinase